MIASFCSSAGLCVTLWSDAHGVAGRGRGLHSSSPSSEAGRHWHAKHSNDTHPPHTPPQSSSRSQQGSGKLLKRRIEFTNACWDKNQRLLALGVREDPLIPVNCFNWKDWKLFCFCPRLMETAKEMTRESLPIKCLEAVILGMYPFACLWLFLLQHCLIYCPSWMVFEIVTAKGECQQLGGLLWYWSTSCWIA